MSAPPRDVELVQRWLRDLVGLPPAVSRRFHDEAVDVEALVELDDRELTNLGVSKMGWQKKLVRRAREELQARSSTSSKRDLQRQSTSDPRQLMTLLLSPIDPASRTYCDQSWEVTEVIDEAGLSHGLAEDEASQSAMAWHESPSGGSSPWQDCHKDGHGESVAGCNTANTGGSGADTDAQLTLQTEWVTTDHQTLVLRHHQILRSSGKLWKWGKDFGLAPCCFLPCLTLSLSCCQFVLTR